MIRTLFISISIILSFNSLSYSQERSDLGIQLGGTYYIGDYNFDKPLYQASFGLGIIYRYNLNKYYSLRLSAYYGELKGSYSSFNHYLPGITGTFSKKLIETEGLLEINFMSFTTQHLNKDNFSPYVILGLGAAYIGGSFLPHIPFGVGIKFCPTSRMTIGAEWKLSKTFNDNIDSYQNPYDGSKAILHNNDWFSFIGLFITFRLYNYSDICPVYQ